MLKKKSTKAESRREKSQLLSNTLSEIGLSQIGTRDVSWDASHTLVVFTNSSGESAIKGKEVDKSSESEKSKYSKPKINTGRTAWDQECLALAELSQHSGKPGEVTYYRARTTEQAQILLVGIGAVGKVDAETLRSAAGSILETLQKHKCAKVSVIVDSLARGATPENLAALAEGFVLSGYRFDEAKSKKDETPGVSIHLRTARLQANLKKAVDQAVVVADTVNFSRRLGDLPGNLMTPTILAETVVEAIRGTSIKAEIWDKARITKEKMGGLLGVAQGSAQEPRFIVLRYNGGAKAQKPVALVGKGLTFDSGGISIKPSAKMEEMKYDMCGGANMIGTILAAARCKMKVNLICIVPATENMPGSRATKPGDIHTARNGVTFEVNNTDAEGRLILADALCYATEQEPAAILDAATLTGAIVVALGNVHTGFYTRHDKLAQAVNKATQQSGELMWRMPLTDAHVKDMKGSYADLSNISSGNGAGSATAAAFLEQFVGKGIPWVHFDIAGTAWAVGNRLSYCPKKGASGVLIRTLLKYLEQ